MDTREGENKNEMNEAKMKRPRVLVDAGRDEAKQYSKDMQGLEVVPAVQRRRPVLQSAS